MSLKETFIKNLAEISTGKKQKEIAEIMGCSEGTISKYLNPLKKRLSNRRNAIQFSRMLQCFHRLATWTK